MSLPPAWQHFQAELLEALDDGGPVDDVVARAQAAAPGPDAAAWVSSWQPAEVELASLLVRTWAVRDRSV